MTGTEIPYFAYHNVKAVSRRPYMLPIRGFGVAKEAIGVESGIACGFQILFVFTFVKMALERRESASSPCRMLFSDQPV